MQEVLQILANKRQPNNDLVRQAFITILEGAASDEEIKGFLLGMNGIKLTADYITIGAQVLRQFMENPVKAPDDAIDVCGTGGDSSNTYNISTATALVVAACGVPVAKHGNRSVSSNSGSSEVLEALGVKLSPNPANIEECIEKANIGFMFAPNHHPAMRHAAKARQELGVRTIFNLLGPLANPASVQRQLIGVFSPKWLEPIAQSLKRLGTEKAWVVCGQDAESGNYLDELTITGENQICILENGKIMRKKFSAADIGLSSSYIKEVIGGDANHNALALKGILENNPIYSAYSNMVLLNSAAALCVANKANSIENGIDTANSALISGSVDKIMKLLAETSQVQLRQN